MILSTISPQRLQNAWFQKLHSNLCNTVNTVQICMDTENGTELEQFIVQHSENKLPKNSQKLNISITNSGRADDNINIFYNS